jgi:hypothetical protein
MNYESFEPFLNGKKQNNETVLYNIEKKNNKIDYDTVKNMIMKQNETNIEVLDISSKRQENKKQTKFNSITKKITKKN